MKIYERQLPNSNCGLAASGRAVPQFEAIIAGGGPSVTGDEATLDERDRRFARR